ncbi:MAG: replicative DNA helicase [Lachnospiraceae bacterium]|jgi:replicative DNA helicase
MDENILKRVPPHNDEAEKSVVGAMLMNRSAIVTASEILDSTDFYNYQYGVIFETITELYDNETPVDTVTLNEALKEKKLSPQLSGIDYIREILITVPTSANVRYYAEIVKEKSLLRKLIEASRTIEEDCFGELKKADEILDETEKNIFSVISQNNSEDFKTIKQIVNDTLDKIDRASKTQSHVTGIPTGYYDLDGMTAGLQPSDFILLAARPSMGKTALALNILSNIAFKSKLPVAFFSVEMSSDTLMNRLLSMRSLVDAQKIRTGQMRDEEWKNLIIAADEIGGSKICIDATPGITISELRSKARKFKLDYDIQCIMIDYLQLMSGNSKAQNRQQEISEISRALKALARELDIPVIALSQLNRSVELRDDKRPMLSDLRESGAIEQDADVVMFIYRDEYYHKDSEDAGIAEVIIAKQRNGPIGTAKLLWRPENTRFENMAKSSRRKE